MKNDIDDEIDNEINQIYNEQALKTIIAHIIMCADELKDLGFNYESLKDYI
nr:MAG TPA: hypothetical protein [Caudoviricetes sp.]